jgi:hypothetical protein
MADAIYASMTNYFGAECENHSADIGVYVFDLPPDYRWELEFIAGGDGSARMSLLTKTQTPSWTRGDELCAWDIQWPCAVDDAVEMAIGKLTDLRLRITDRTRGDGKLIIDRMANCSDMQEMIDLWRDACRVARRMDDKNAEAFIEELHDVARITFDDDPYYR